MAYQGTLSARQVYNRLRDAGMLRRSNCLVEAVREFCASPRTVRIRVERNRSGRWHCYWTRSGQPQEFYAPGRSSKTYRQNLLYFGFTKSKDIARP